MKGQRSKFRKAKGNTILGKVPDVNYTKIWKEGKKERRKEREGREEKREGEKGRRWIPFNLWNIDLYMYTMKIHEVEQKHLSLLPERDASMTGSHPPPSATASQIQGTPSVLRQNQDVNHQPSHMAYNNTAVSWPPTTTTAGPGKSNSVRANSSGN